MSHETVWYSRPRNYGKGSRGCRVTGDKKKSGVIRKYGLNMSRQAFREQAEAIGFHKEFGIDDGTKQYR
ncbi:40S ribosomal protein S29 [Lasiodiplodia hormozganensis]|uniref:40S ribosomal protein S29 n=1 Tax=Lasiodiplodia hormozganensis TaxID=869390 RepID=A0AA39X6I8_9PEZI|nr:40S ribosomal protein S29 [Lasiodiplodia hormozganensis]